MVWNQGGYEGDHRSCEFVNFEYMNKKFCRDHFL